MDDKTLERLDFDKVRRRLAEHTTFSAGRHLALDLVPSSDAEAVAARLALTGEARDYTDRHGAPPIAGAHDLRQEIEAATRGKILLVQELLEISDTLSAARRMRRALSGAGNRERRPRLAQVAEVLDPCPALYDAIQAALDDEGNVLDSASPALGRIRREMRLAHDRLMRRLEGIVNSAGKRQILQEALITQRRGRYVVPVKSEFRSRMPGVVHDTSDSGATVFIEPLAVVELGNRYRELKLDEEKEVERILRELSGLVADEADALVSTIEALAELDLAFACGDYAHALRAVAPEIVDAPLPLLDFPKARHPLLDPETVVPTSIRVGESFRQLVITGPNTGGKTVTLKTTGLLTLMAQSGLHIPAADGARLAVFDAVFADIGDEQSIEQSLSTFSSHLTNIISFLDEATDSSLVLLDELGAGTDPVEGAALAEALLRHLHHRGVATIASTHYSELKAYAHSQQGVRNASMEFDVDTLQPTYELTIGLPGRSNALAIASRLGLPQEIAEAARGSMAVSEVVMDDLLAEIRDARSQAEEDRRAAAEARRQADAWAAKLEAAVHDVQSERADILSSARRQAEAELEAARIAIRKIERRARSNEATSQAIAEAASRLDRVSEVLEAAAEPEPEVPPPPSDLRPGAHVLVTSVNQAGEVLRLVGKDAEVQLGRLRLTVPVSDLQVQSHQAEPPENEVAPTSGPESTLHRTEASEDVPMELDLRGMRVAEGLDELDLYLDRAMLSGLPWVRVIHGHGTGAMRTAVRDTLRHHPHVKRSRRGEPGEGGDGVTLVYFE